MTTKFDSVKYSQISKNVYYNANEDIIYKVVPFINDITNILHNYEHFKTIKLLTDNINLSNLLLFPKIINIDTDEMFSIIEMQFINGKFATKDNFLEPDIYFKALSILHNQMFLCDKDFEQSTLTWSYFPQIYWVYIEKFEPNHNCVNFFIKYEISNISLNYFKFIHNDLHFGNIIESNNKYYIIDIDEIKLCDFRNDIGISCANLFSEYYKNIHELHDFILNSLISYGYKNPLLSDIKICAIYGLRKLYHAELFYKIKQSDKDLIIPIIEQQKLFESLLTDFKNF